MPSQAQLQQNQRNGLIQPFPNSIQIPGIPPTESAIMQSHKCVDGALSGLHSVLNELESRIQPALRIEPAGSPCAPQVPVATPSSISGKLDGHAVGIQLAINRIQEILRLLEM